MNYSPVKMREILQKHNFDFKKMYGQNFIIDENTIDSIIQKTNIDNNTLVIEIGPGAGSLTYKLALLAKHVLCYEIDTTLSEVLKDNLAGYNNVDIIFGDFLKADVTNDIKKYKYNKLYVVANLPYYITTPIIIKLIEDKIDVSKIVVMVQKEVGNRFKASPNTKNYSSLSIYLEYYYNISKLMDVSRNAFLPKPNVDSIVVQFIKKDNLLKLKDETIFFKLVRDSFKQKRKILKNNLKNYNLDIVESILKKYGFDLNVRAEQLSIEIFVDIANNLKNP